MTTPAMTTTPTASPAMSSPEEPPPESAAGLTLGEGAAVVGWGSGEALVGAAEVGDADVGAGPELVGAGPS